MGKWRSEEQKQSYWGYWPGTWSASPGQNGKAPWKQKNGPPVKGIPAYDAQKVGQDVKGAASTASAAVAAPPDRDASLIQELQKAVNSARKAEGKVKKLMAERTERQQQWTAWEADLRKTYSKERGRFNAAITRIDAEMKEALRLQEAARLEVRNVACQSNAGMDIEEPRAFDEDFDALIHGGGADPWEDSTQDAVLQRALAATMTAADAGAMSGGAPMSLITPPRSAAVAPRTPQLGPGAWTQRTVQPPASAVLPGSRLQPFPPPAERPRGIVSTPTVVENAPVLEDPYTALAGGAISAPAQETIVGQLQSPANGAPKTPRPRHGIKDAAKPGGPIQPGRAFPGFHDKVDEKRAVLTAQVEEQMNQRPAVNFVIHDDDQEPSASMNAGGEVMD